MKFKFQSPTNSFSCKLKCVRCLAKTQNGAHCKMRTCIGAPYCWHHLRLKKLKIKQSTIDGAGKGLFAFDPSARINSIVFEPEDEIIEYEGETIKKQLLDSRYGDYTAPYALQNTPNKFVDSACYRGVASLANTNLDEFVNAKFFKIRRRLVLVAIKPIRNGHEIFADYGSEYRLFEPNVFYKTY